MRRTLYSIFFCILFGMFLSAPSIVFDGAKIGLMSWFHTVLPTLFPFMVLTTILIHSGAIHLVSKITAPLLCPLFRISPNACLAVVGGFLCGYPMGAKIISDLWETGRIEKQEALYLLSFCNNVSPSFVISYIITKTLSLPILLLPTLVILFMAPMLSSIVFRRFYPRKFLSARIEHSSFSWIQLMDLAISSGIENITKIGGYIIFFSVLVNLAKQIPVSSEVFHYFLLPSLEITNGITIIDELTLSLPIKYLLIMMHTSFGGICAIFQTKCVSKKLEYSLKVYAIEKLVTTLVTSLLTILYIQIFMLS